MKTLIPPKLKCEWCDKDCDELFDMTVDDIEWLEVCEHCKGILDNTEDYKK